MDVARAEQVLRRRLAEGRGDDDRRACGCGDVRRAAVVGDEQAQSRGGGDEAGDLRRFDGNGALGGQHRDQPLRQPALAGAGEDQDAGASQTPRLSDHLVEVARVDLGAGEAEGVRGFSLAVDAKARGQ